MKSTLHASHTIRRDAAAPSSPVAWHGVPALLHQLDVTLRGIGRKLWPLVQEGDLMPQQGPGDASEHMLGW
jgi:hypothetical protein